MSSALFDYAGCPLQERLHIHRDYFFIAGFSAYGFMHGHIAGKLMSELILDGRYQTLDVSMLDLARFDEQRLIQEYNVV
jgi:glycine/D-amino acid oxidase-like deaminating enzyme